MAGEAITNSFMLASATVMIGPQASVLGLMPSTHSIGLVKNVQVTTETQRTELRQGVTQTLVDSQLTDNKVSVSFEGYEFTAKNLQYGLGLDGSALGKTSVYLTSAAALTAATTVVIADSADSSASFTAGKYVYIQKGASDVVHVAQLAANATFNLGDTTLTLTAATALPVDFAIGSSLSLVHEIQVGSRVEQPFFGCKIVGIMANGSRPVTLLLPKVRIKRGFSMAFSSSDYGNLPFELEPYDVTLEDDFTASAGPDLYTMFNGHPVKMFTGQ